MTTHIVDTTIPFLSVTLWGVVLCVLVTFFLAIKAAGQLRRKKERTLFKAACFMLLAMILSLILGVVAFVDFLFL